MTHLDLATTLADDAYASGAPQAVVAAAPVLAVLSLGIFLFLAVRAVREAPRGRRGQ